MVIARYSNVHFVRKTVIQAKPNQRFFCWRTVRQSLIPLKMSRSCKISSTCQKLFVCFLLILCF